MPTLKATLFLLLVLLSSCNARQFKGTNEDSANGDKLSLNVQEKREDETKTENFDSAEEDTESAGLVRRILESSSNKRQDDMPGVWGRSIETKDLAKTNGDEMQGQLVKLDESEEEEERRDEDDEPQGLREREIEKRPPGLWGREFGNKPPNPPGLWGRGIENKPLPGLWGREIENRPPGLWGREIENGPPGLWGREIENGPPGLWGREIENGPPGLWGREIENGPPGLWGREIENGPPGLWGREIENQPPGLWGRGMSRVENWDDVEDKDEVIHDDE